MTENPRPALLVRARRRTAAIVLGTLAGTGALTVAIAAHQTVAQAEDGGDGGQGAATTRDGSGPATTGTATTGPATTGPATTGPATGSAGTSSSDRSAPSRRSGVGPGSSSGSSSGSSDGGSHSS